MPISNSPFDAFFACNKTLEELTTTWPEIIKNLKLDSFSSGAPINPESANAIIKMINKKRLEKNKWLPLNGRVIIGIENLSGFTAALVSYQNTVRFQILFFKNVPGHSLILDITFNATQNKFEIVCLEPAQVVDQAELLIKLVEHFKKQKYSYEIIACQGGLQKDHENCGVISLIAMREFSKLDIFSLLKKQQYCKIPDYFTVDKWQKKQFAEIEGVNWVPVSCMPQKIVLTQQSFSELKKELGGDKYAEKIIQAHKDKYSLTTRNEYIIKKRTTYKNNFEFFAIQTFGNDIEKEFAHIKINDPISAHSWEYFLLYHANELEKFMHSMLTKFIINAFPCSKIFGTSTALPFSGEKPLITRIHFETLAEANRAATFLTHYHIEAHVTPHFLDANIMLVQFEFSSKAAAICFYHNYIVKKSLLDFSDIPHFQKLIEQSLRYGPKAVLMERFLMVIEDGNIKGVKKFLSNGINPNEYNDPISKMSPLLTLAMVDNFNDNHYQIAELLIKDYKADVNITAYNKTTPLHQAAFRGNEKLVKLLLEYNADVLAQDEKNRVPFYFAAANQHPQIATLLINLMRAKCTEDKLQVYLKDAYFIAAFDHRPLGVLEYLLSRKLIDVNCIDDDTGNSALHYAVLKDDSTSQENFAVISCLRQYHINEEIKNKDGKTAMESAHTANLPKEIIDMDQDRLHSNNCP